MKYWQIIAALACAVGFYLLLAGPIATYEAGAGTLPDKLFPPRSLYPLIQGEIAAEISLYVSKIRPLDVGFALSLGWFLWASLSALGARRFRWLGPAAAVTDLVEGQLVVSILTARFDPSQALATALMATTTLKLATYGAALGLILVLGVTKMSQIR